MWRVDVGDGGWGNVVGVTRSRLVNWCGVSLCSVFVRSSFLCVLRFSRSWVFLVLGFFRSSFLSFFVSLRSSVLMQGPRGERRYRLGREKLEDHLATGPRFDRVCHQPGSAARLRR